MKRFFQFQYVLNGRSRDVWFYADCREEAEQRAKVHLTRQPGATLLDRCEEHDEQSARIIVGPHRSLANVLPKADREEYDQDRVAREENQRRQKRGFAEIKQARLRCRSAI